MARRFYLEHDVEVNGKMIKIIGIAHGGAGFPVGRTTAAVILKKHRENPHAGIYSEDVDRSHLPQKLIRKAKPLEKKEVKDQTYKLAAETPAIASTYKSRLKYQKFRFRKMWLWLKELVNLPREIPSSITTLGYRQIGQRSSPTTRQFYRFSHLYRSLKMADALLEAPENEILAVVGAAHAPLVKKFLENPKLRERYRRLWEKPATQ